MIIAIFGPPGAGKGTQGARLAAAHGLAHLSTGNMLREVAASETVLGREISATLARGHFVTDAMAREMVAERLRAPDCAQGAVLDGYPRTLPQVDDLEAILSEKGETLHAALCLEVGRDELVRRILSRGAGRADDTAEVIEERLSVFRDKTRPVIERFAATGRLHRVEGEGSPDAVFRALQDALAAPCA